MANAGLATAAADSITLTELGMRQATSVAKACPTTPALIVVSPFLRARQTAEPLIRRFPTPLVEEWPVQEFTYLRVDGTTTATDRRPKVVEYWERCDPHYCDGPGTESFSDFTNRARSAIEDLRRNEHQCIAVFTHGQFIRAVMWLVLTSPKIIDSDSMKEFYSFLHAVPFPNVASIELRFVRDRIFLGPVTVLS